MTVDNADEVMAEFLLKGGKMLAKSCKICGHPLFEYKGETQCVVCPLNISEEGHPESELPPPTSVTEESPIKPPRSSPPVQTEISGHPPTLAATRPQGRIAAELEETIAVLCDRIRREQRADECLTLMMAVERGIEAFMALDQR